MGDIISFAVICCPESDVQRVMHETQKVASIAKRVLTVHQSEIEICMSKDETSSSVDDM
jgi:hypothetical protein